MKLFIQPLHILSKDDVSLVIYILTSIFLLNCPMRKVPLSYSSLFLKKDFCWGDGAKYHIHGTETQSAVAYFVGIPSSFLCRNLFDRQKRIFRNNFWFKPDIRETYCLGYRPHPSMRIRAPCCDRHPQPTEEQIRNVCQEWPSMKIKEVFKLSLEGRI